MSTLAQRIRKARHSLACMDADGYGWMRGKPRHGPTRVEVAIEAMERARAAISRDQETKAYAILSVALERIAEMTETRED